MGAMVSSPHVTPVCGKCGSSDVYGSAALVWNDIEQIWMIGVPFDVDLAESAFVPSQSGDITGGNCVPCRDITFFEYTETSGRRKE
jgi:hypothetical protein